MCNLILLQSSSNSQVHRLTGLNSINTHLLWTLTWWHFNKGYHSAADIGAATSCVKPNLLQTRRSIFIKGRIPVLCHSEETQWAANSWGRPERRLSGKTQPVTISPHYTALACVYPCGHWLIVMCLNWNCTASIWTENHHLHQCMSTSIDTMLARTLAAPPNVSGVREDLCLSLVRSGLN